MRSGVEGPIRKGMSGSLIRVEVIFWFSHTFFPMFSMRNEKVAAKTFADRLSANGVVRMLIRASVFRNESR
jgi:hypothetical protein